MSAKRLPGKPLIDICGAPMIVRTFRQCIKVVPRNRILVATDLFGRGMDIERVNIVVNYDFPKVADQYLHRVGRAGRFGTKGLAISFCASEEDKAVLKDVQSRFSVDIATLPDQIEVSSYMNA